MPIDLLAPSIGTSFHPDKTKGLRGAFSAPFTFDYTFYYHNEMLQVEFDVDTTVARVDFPSGGLLGLGLLPSDNLTLTNGVDTYTLVITALNDDSLTYNVGTSSPPPTGSYADYDVHVTTNVRRVEFGLGIITNDDGDGVPAYLQPDVEAKWITLENANISTTPQPMSNFSGYKYIETSEPPEISRIATPTGISTGFEQVFRVTGSFVIPRYLIEQFELDGSLDIENVEQFFASNCVRLVPYLAVGTVTTNVREDSFTSGNVSSFTVEGDTGFFGETLNGQQPYFAIAAQRFNDPTSGTDIGYLPNAPCVISIDVVGTPGLGEFTNASTNSFYIELIQIKDEATYEKALNYDQNTRRDLVVADDSGVPSLGTYLTLVSGSYSGGVLTIQALFDPLTDWVNGDRYLLHIGVQSTGTPSLFNTDLTALLVLNDTIKPYIDVTGLGGRLLRMMEMPYTTTNKFKDYRGWINDDLLVEAALDVPAASPNGTPQTLNGVQLKVEVEGNDRLDTLYSGPILQSGDNVDLGYQLADSRNQATFDGTNLVSGLRLRFEEWIAANTTNPDFALFRNMNWSNFSLIDFYQLYVVLYAYITVGDEEVVHRHRAQIFALDWFEDEDGFPVTKTLTTTGLTSGIDFGGGVGDGSEQISVVARFEGAGLDKYDFATTDFYAELSYCGANSGTVNTTQKITSYKMPQANNGWLGLIMGMAQVTKVSPNVVEASAILNIPFLVNNAATLGLNDPLDLQLMARLGRLFEEIIIDPTLANCEYLRDRDDVLNGTYGFTSGTYTVSEFIIDGTDVLALANDPFFVVDFTTFMVDGNGHPLNFVEGLVDWLNQNGSMQAFTLNWLLSNEDEAGFSRAFVINYPETQEWTMSISGTMNGETDPSMIYTWNSYQYPVQNVNLSGAYPVDVECDRESPTTFEDCVFASPLTTAEERAIVTPYVFNVISVSVNGSPVASPATITLSDTDPFVASSNPPSRWIKALQTFFNAVPALSGFTVAPNAVDGASQLEDLFRVYFEAGEEFEIVIEREDLAQIKYTRQSGSCSIDSNNLISDTLIDFYTLSGPDTAASSFVFGAGAKGIVSGDFMDNPDQVVLRMFDRNDDLMFQGQWVVGADVGVTAPVNTAGLFSYAQIQPYIFGAVGKLNLDAGNDLTYDSLTHIPSNCIFFNHVTFSLTHGLNYTAGTVFRSFSMEFIDAGGFPNISTGAVVSDLVAGVGGIGVIRSYAKSLTLATTQTDGDEITIQGSATRNINGVTGTPRTVSFGNSSVSGGNSDLEDNATFFEDSAGYVGGSVSTSRDANNSIAGRLSVTGFQDAFNGTQIAFIDTDFAITDPLFGGPEIELADGTLSCTAALNLNGNIEQVGFESLTFSASASIQMSPGNGINRYGRLEARLYRNTTSSRRASPPFGNPAATIFQISGTSVDGDSQNFTEGDTMAGNINLNITAADFADMAVNGVTNCLVLVTLGNNSPTVNLVLPNIVPFRANSFVCLPLEIVVV